MEYFDDFGRFCNTLRTNGAFLVVRTEGKTNRGLGDVDD